MVEGQNTYTLTLKIERNLNGVIRFSQLPNKRDRWREKKAHELDDVNVNRNGWRGLLNRLQSIFFVKSSIHSLDQFENQINEINDLRECDAEGCMSYMERISRKNNGMRDERWERMAEEWEWRK